MPRTMRSEIRSLQLALRRLEQSKGRRIARRNARRAFLKALNECKHILREYPTVNDDGSENIIRIARGVRCPSCNVPMNSLKAFCRHWAERHTLLDSYGRPFRSQVKCKCGKNFGYYSDKSVRAFHRHVAGLKDVPMHFLMAALAGLGNGK